MTRETRLIDAVRLSRRNLLAGGLAASAFVAAPGTIRRAAAAQTLRFGLSSFPPSFAPWANTGTAAETVKLQSFRGLVGYAPNGDLRPELAESWTMESPTVAVFKLRAATFHNGDPVTAEDVKFSFESIAKPDSGAWMRAFFARFKAIEAVDAKTVRLVLAEPDATLLPSLASYDAVVVSRRSMQETPDKPAGAGPYVVTGVERGAWIKLEAFRNFYRPGLPRTPALTFVVYADENARVAALEAGDVDLIEYVPAFSMADIEKSRTLTLDAVEGPASLVIFNVKDGPFKDARVRRAVAYAIDRQAIIDGAFAGRGALSGPLPIPRSSRFFDASMQDYFARDIRKAKALLAEAGMPGGFRTNLLATSQYSVHRDPALVVQQSLADVGIQAELVLPDWPTRVKLGNEGQYHISVSATSADNNDPATLGPVIGGGLPPAFSRPFGYGNAEVDRLLAAGARELDEARRKAIYAELQKVSVEDPGILSLVFRAQGYAARKAVTGFRNIPGFATFNSGVTIEDVVVG